jgi:Uma2 family endonuclease
MRDNSINQGRILRNLMRLLDGACGHSLYEIFPRGVQLWLPEQGMGLFPDAMVVAGEPLLHQGHSDKLINPCVVFEIVSEPTQPHDPEAQHMADRSKMFTQCRTIPYLQEYVFIYRDQMRIEQFHRAQENLWGMTVQSDFDSVAELTITDVRLPMMDLYKRVDFELTD